LKSEDLKLEYGAFFSRSCFLLELCFEEKWNTEIADPYPDRLPSISLFLSAVSAG
jgi:hypothetical protein